MTNEMKTPDENSLEDSFNDDFHFEENDADNPPIKTTSKKPLDKKIVGSIFSVIIVGVLIIGYKSYNASKNNRSTKPIPTASPEVAKLGQPTAPTLPTQTLNASEQNFNDIAQAFSNADQSTLAPSKNANSETSLSDLQKELFTLEQPQSKPTTTVATDTSSINDKSIPDTANPTSTEATQLSQNLNRLNQQIDYILNQIRHLDAYSREVAENLTKLNEAINIMDNRLSTLTTTTSTLSQDVGNVKNEMGHVKQVLQEDGLALNGESVAAKKQMAEKNSTIAIEEPEYIVHAVIPGRAWLKSLKGQIITVAEGDTIGNYGKILVIDPNNGVVLTSSGIAFR